MDLLYDTTAYDSAKHALEQALKRGRMTTTIGIFKIIEDCQNLSVEDIVTR